MRRITRIKKKAAGSYCDAAIGNLADTGIDTTAFEALFAHHRTVNDYNTEVMNNQAAVATEAEKLKDEIRKQIVGGSGAAEAGVRTADSPLPIARATLTNPSLINRAVSKEDTFRVDAHLTTLKLRLKTRLDGKRWRSFLNYEEAAVRDAHEDDHVNVRYIDAFVEQVAGCDNVERALSKGRHCSIPFPRRHVTRDRLSAKTKQPQHCREAFGVGPLGDPFRLIETDVV